MAEWDIRVSSEELELVKRLINMYLASLSGTPYDLELRDYRMKVVQLNERLNDSKFKGDN